MAVSLITDLGPGESEVLMLALEMPESVALLDDALRGFRLAQQTRDAVLKLAGEL